MTSRVDAALGDRWESVMLGNYGTPRVELTHGKGAQVWDRLGNQYTDLLAGIAVSTLGHADPRITAAVAEQVAALAHCSNLYAHEPGLRLAERLLQLAGSEGRVLFTQDGATANEAALKLARRYGWQQDPSGGKQVIVAMRGSFHGRTMGALAVTGNPAKRDPFEPFGIEVRFLDYGDFRALEQVDAAVAAVIVEPIQGEGGMVVPPPGYLAAVRSACDAAGALLIVDEVQSGIGRTGHWFAAIAQGVRPDLLTLAKGLAGGLPLGAVLVEPAHRDVLQAGEHGTTFGGNPVSCAAALAVLDAISADGLLAHVQEVGEWFAERVHRLRSPEIKEVRGAGLWFGIQFRSDIAAAVEKAAFEAGFLVNAVKPSVLRLAPPLNIPRAELDAFADVLPTLIEEATR